MIEPRFNGCRITQWKAKRKTGFSAPRMRVLQAFGDINDIQPDKAIRVGLTQNIPEIVKEIVKHLKTIGFYSHTTYARDIWRMLARARDYKYWTHGRKS